MIWAFLPEIKGSILFYSKVAMQVLFLLVTDTAFDSVIVIRQLLTIIIYGQATFIQIFIVVQLSC